LDERNSSFGYWLRRRRKALDLTQEALARAVACSRFTIRKIEADERRPSRRLAERLAERLAIPQEERDAFMAAARALRATVRLEVERAPLAQEPGDQEQAEAERLVGRTERRLAAPVMQSRRPVTAERDAEAQSTLAGAEAERRSLAVLPFDNLSSDPENAYVAAGMQEEILTRFSRLAHRFRVISRTSVQRYATARPPIRTIAQELGADIILEGSVRSARDKLRIDARLIDAATDGVVWSDSYDGQRDDVLSMQSAVSIDVARALRVELSTAEEARLDRALTGSTRAYELYAQANYLYTSVSPNEALARRLMESAVEADPEFAAALGWLAATDVLALVNTFQGDAVDPTRREQIVRAVHHRGPRPPKRDPKNL
jgi:TolB-like protein/DNA-binding XRE family transcriptional regulator